jgi:DNA-binding transcriptional MerR regulator
MKDLLSINEFSQLTGIEVSTLHYWDEIGVFSPIERNPENNYRYYSIAQIPTLNFVTTLSELDVPLRTIAELRKDRNPENMLKLLEKKERELDMELRAIRLRSSIIHTRQELIRYGLRADETQISVLPREEKALILWSRNEYGETDTFIKPLAAFISQATEQRINLSFPVGGYWESMESFEKEPSRPDRFFSIDPTGTHIRKAGKYLIGFARGYYGEMGDLPERMAAYVKENALFVSGAVYTMYLHEEICTADKSQYLSQTCVAVSDFKRKTIR